MGIKKYIYLLFPYILFAQNNQMIDVVKKEFFLFSQKSAPIDTTVNKKNDSFDYHIALLLPFCIESNTSLLDIDIDSIGQYSQHNLFKKSLISIDFFHGFLMALTNSVDLNFKISVFDIKHGDDSQIILDQIITDRYLKGVDLIIGPLFTNNVIYFTDNFYKKIPIVAPFSKKQHIVMNNPNVIQIQPSLESQLKIFSSYIFDNHSNDNIILIRRDTIFDNSLRLIRETDSVIEKVDTIIPDDVYISEILLDQVDTVSIDFKEIKVNTNVVDSIYHELDTLGERNIILIASEDNVFVTDLLSKLHACRDSGMIVYGLSNLYNFNHLPFTDLMDMNLSFPYHKFDNSDVMIQFIIEFYDNYKYVPNLRYSSVGYEIASYFSQLLFQYDDFLTMLSDVPPIRILENVYDFQKINQGGYKNQGVMLLRYDNFGYKRID